MLFFLLIANAIVIGGFCAYIAGEKNRSGGNWFIFGALFSFLALFALIAIPKLEKSDGTQELSSPAVWASVPNPSACTSESFQHEPDLSSGKYQLFLTKKFSIEKNITLEKYVVDEQLFTTLDAALAFAHDLNQKQELQGKLQKLQYAYLIRELTEYGKAKSAGVILGDILISYNNYSITSDQDFTDATAALTAPDTVILVIRDGHVVSIPVTAGRLGLNGGIVHLDEVSAAARLKSLAAA